MIFNRQTSFSCPLLLHQRMSQGECVIHQRSWGQIYDPKRSEPLAQWGRSCLFLFPIHAQLASGLQQKPFASCWAAVMEVKRFEREHKPGNTNERQAIWHWPDASYDYICKTQGLTLIKSTDALLISFHRALQTVALHPHPLAVIPPPDDVREMSYRNVIIHPLRHHPFSEASGHLGHTPMVRGGNAFV